MSASALTAPAERRDLVPEAHFREASVRVVPVAPARASRKVPWMLFAFVAPLLPFGALAAGFSLIASIPSESRRSLEWLPFALAFVTYVVGGVLLHRFTRVSGVFLLLMPVVWAALSFGEAWIWIEFVIR